MPLSVTYHQRTVALCAYQGQTGKLLGMIKAMVIINKDRYITKMLVDDIKSIDSILYVFAVFDDSLIYPSPSVLVFQALLSRLMTYHGVPRCV